MIGTGALSLEMDDDNAHQLKMRVEGLLNI